MQTSYQNLTISVITPCDSFNLAATMESGQVFNYTKFQDGIYLCVYQDNCALIGQDDSGSLNVLHLAGNSVEPWLLYFDLHLDYDAEFKKLDLDPFAQRCVDASEGIHILNQDPWEMCLSYIISQRNKIELISQIVKRISERFGTHIATVGGTPIYAFPTVAQLSSATSEELRECGVGFRDTYLIGFIKYVTENPGCIEDWRDLQFNALRNRLMQFTGIGPKVADCIALFGYHHLEAFPIDLWIQRIIDGAYNGNRTITSSFGNMAGVIQQYMFNYVRNMGGNYNL